MKKLLVWCLLAIFAADHAHAQAKIKYSKLFESYYSSYWSYTLGAGTGFYRGDVCGRPECSTYKPAVSIGVNYKIQPHIVVGTEFTYFQFQAKSRNDENVNIYLLSSTNWDLKLFARYSFFEDNHKTASEKIALRRINPYLQGGIAVVNFNPKLALANPVIDYVLPPDPKPYSTTSLAYPATLGITYAFSRRVSLLMEGTYTFTSTDFLDDHGPGRSGDNNGRKDSYALAMLKLQFTPGAPGGAKKAKQMSKKDLKPKEKGSGSKKSKKSGSKKGKKSKPKISRSAKGSTKKAPNRHPNK